MGLTCWSHSRCSLAASASPAWRGPSPRGGCQRVACEGGAHAQGRRPARDGRREEEGRERERRGARGAGRVQVAIQLVEVAEARRDGAADLGPSDGPTEAEEGVRASHAATGARAAGGGAAGGARRGEAGGRRAAGRAGRGGRRSHGGGPQPRPSSAGGGLVRRGPSLRLSVAGAAHSQVSVSESSPSSVGRVPLRLWSPWVCLREAGRGRRVQRGVKAERRGAEAEAAYRVLYDHVPSQAA